MNELMEDLYYLNSINSWFKPKHLSMYRDIIFRVSKESMSLRRKVGSGVLSKNGSLFLGYNGLPPGHETDICEDENFKTKDDVIHAEENALNKMIRENVDIQDSIIFITDSPCGLCTENIILKYGIKAVFYFRQYRDTTPIENLKNNGVIVHYIDENILEEIRLRELKK